MIEMSVEAKQELGWWMTEMQNHNGALLLMVPPNLVIESDASRLGWGAILKVKELRIRGQWLTSEQEMHINCLELLAASLAIQSSFAKEMKNINILARTENVYAQGYRNHLFKCWDSWCQAWCRDPIRGTIADVLNFLADLFDQGYQYR